VEHEWSIDFFASSSCILLTALSGNVTSLVYDREKMAFHVVSHYIPYQYVQPHCHVHQDCNVSGLVYCLYLDEELTSMLLMWLLLWPYISYVWGVTHNCIFGAHKFLLQGEILCNLS